MYVEYPLLRYVQLLQGDFESLKLSEIHWHGNGSEKFIFDYPSACIIYFAGEVTIIEYGQEEPLGSIRTSFTNSHVLSLRINERKPKNLVTNHSSCCESTGLLIHCLWVCLYRT